MKKRRLVMTVIGILLSFTLAGSHALADDLKENWFQRIRTVYDVIEVWHKDGADVETFTNGAIRGGIDALGDPYTAYYSREEFASFMDGLNGSFSGIGAYLEQVDNYVVVSAPIKGSPAVAAGLASGDRLLEVDGKSLVGATTETAVRLIRGPSGTTVTLKVERPSEKRVFTLVITRATIHIPEVEHKMLEGQIGYIQLATFGDEAADEFYAAVDALKGLGARGIVLDLRQNPGGYLQAAVEIAGAFVPKGEPVVWEKGKAGRTALTSSGRLINLPTVVLVDGGSASASEVLAGALQDYGAAKLVGVQTFGKGTVQQILTLSTGEGMKVTVAEYVTPKERKVQGIGLTPDVKVEASKAVTEMRTPLTLDRPLFASSIGLDVQAVQQRLQVLGYKPEVRGYFGANTATAVETFRRDNGLPTSDVVDQDFVNKLNERIRQWAESDARPDAQLSKAVEVLQTQLK